MNYLITQYPVTRDYLERLQASIDDPVESIVVSGISPRGYFNIYRLFRSLKCDAVFLPGHDPSTRPLLAPLQILAMLVKTRRRYIVGADFSLAAIGITDGAIGGIRIAFGIVNGVATAIRDWVRLGRYLNTPRIILREKPGKHVLYLKTNLWLGIQAGGSVAHTSGVVKGLLGNGYGVEFVSAEAPIALPQSAALTIRPIAPHATYIIPRELNHYRHNDRFISGVVNLPVRPEGIIYQRLSLGNYAGVMLSRRYGVPLVLEYNGSESWLAKNWGTPLFLNKLALRAEDACLKHAHMVVTVSEVLRNELIERGVEPDRIVAIANGVDAEQFSPERFSNKSTLALRKKYAIPGDAVVVTFVGTFGPWHGAEVFAEAVRRMVLENPERVKSLNLHFMFIGDGVRRPVVEEIISDPEVQKTVTITGLIDQEDTPLHLAASDILVSPHVPNPDGSEFFGSPTKLFEYLASGRTVIASDLNQIGDVLAGSPHIGDLQDSQQVMPEKACAILTMPEDAGEVSKAIWFLAENPEWRLSAGKNARLLAQDRYTWKDHVGAILQGLKQVQALDEKKAKEPLRFLLNGLHSKSGGGLTYLKNILPVMARDRQVDLHLCVHKDQKPSLPENLEDISVHFMDFPQGFWRLQLHEQIGVPKLAKKIGARATFSPANYGPLWAPNPVLLLRNALSVAFVERRPVKLAYWALVYVGTVLSLLTSRRAITVSDYARRAAGGGVMGFFKGRLSVVPHGVSEIFSPPKKGAKRQKFLLAVSDIYVQKNLKNLLYAVARLGKDHPDIFLRIAGRPVDEEYFAELKKIVSREKLDGMVEFLGGVSPKVLVSLYQSCGVFVFPSTVETFGNPLVEAMACGAPIASSNTAAMPEVLGDAAEYFDPGNVQNMAETIGRLMSDRARCRDLSAKAEKRAKHFSWKKTAESTLRIIKEAARPR